MPDDMPASTDLSSIDLASAISSRICHDLVSPVGAIVNGIDLVREIGTPGLDDEVAMIGQSADRASGLLQFFRLAFGAAPLDAQPMGRAVLRDQARGVVEWQRVSLDWDSVDGPAFSRGEAKLLSLMVLCLRSIAGMAGTISVRLMPDATLPMRVVLNGPGTVDADERLSLLSVEQPGPGPSAREVEFVLARQTAQSMGLGLTVQRDEAETSLVALPAARL